MCLQLLHSPNSYHMFRGGKLLLKSYNFAEVISFLTLNKGHIYNTSSLFIHYLLLILVRERLSTFIRFIQHPFPTPPSVYSFLYWYLSLYPMIYEGYTWRKLFIDLPACVCWRGKIGRKKINSSAR